MPLIRNLCAALVAFGLMAAPMPTTADAFGPAGNVQQSTAQARLLAEFNRFAAMSDGTVGISVRNLATDERIALNGHMLFPMASTYKLAVAGTILSMVDRGMLTLDQVNPMRAEQISDSGIADSPFSPGTTLSIHSLLDLMLTRSDNHATDVLVARAGGPEAVNGWLKSIGIRDQRVDSNTAQLLYRAMGIQPGAGSFRQTVAAALESDAALRARDAHDLPNIDFAADPRDTTTPEAMNDLLVALHSGKILKPATTAVLLDIMEHCRTGAKRLKGMLPTDTRIAHKTGSLNGMGNDVGIMTLPDGQIVTISVFVMKDYKGREVRDRIMAEAARAAYDYFLFSPRNTVG